MLCWKIPQSEKSIPDLMSHKKISTVIGLAIVGSLSLAAPASAAVLGPLNNFYNTGYNGTTLEATDSQLEDTHYDLIGVPLGQSEVKVGDTYTGQVYSGSPTSSTATEISPLALAPGVSPNEYPVGDYTYQLSLTSLTPGDLVTITGTVTGDDGIPGIAGDADDMLTDVTGNGVNGSVTSSYTDTENFSLTFTAGASNSIQFTVYNHNGFTGLMVDNLAGTETSPTNSITPEPSTWALLLAGVGMLGFVVVRRARDSRI